MIWLIVAAGWIAAGAWVCWLFCRVARVRQIHERPEEQGERLREELLGKLHDPWREGPPQVHGPLMLMENLFNSVSHPPEVRCLACIAVARLVAQEHALDWKQGRAIIARRIQEGRLEPHTHLETA